MISLGPCTSDAPTLRIRWRPPKHVRERTPEQLAQIREKYHIVVEGEDVPPPIESFTVSSNSLPI